MYLFSPYQEETCCDLTTPTVPVNQGCTSYDQLQSQIFSMSIIPEGSPKPDPWNTEAGWSGVIDNDDPTKGKTVYGIGSLLPVVTNTQNLSSNRIQYVGSRVYELAFELSNMNEGHVELAKKIDCLDYKFCVYVQDIGRTIIGGENGMVPIFRNVLFPFEGENGSKEKIQIFLRFFLDGRYLIV